MSGAKKASPGGSRFATKPYFRKKARVWLVPVPGFDSSAFGAVPVGKTRGGLDTFCQSVKYPRRAKGLVAPLTT